MQSQLHRAQAHRAHSPPRRLRLLRPDPRRAHSPPGRKPAWHRHALKLPRPRRPYSRPSRKPARPPLRRVPRAQPPPSLHRSCRLPRHKPARHRKPARGSNPTSRLRLERQPPRPSLHRKPAPQRACLRRNPDFRPRGLIPPTPISPTHFRLNHWSHRNRRLNRKPQPLRPQRPFRLKRPRLLLLRPPRSRKYESSPKN